MIRVRIKLAVGSDGSWNAGGYGDRNGPASSSGDWVMDAMPPTLTEEDIRIMYVEADVEIPTTPTIQGEIIQ